MLTQYTSGYKSAFGKKGLPQADAIRPVLLLDGNAEECVFLAHEIRALFGEVPVKSFARGVQILRYLSELAVDAMHAEKKPRLILMDLHTPGMDGLSTLKQLRRDYYTADIPVVIISNSCDQDEINQIYQSGANAFLQKPFSRYEFIEVLHHNGDLLHKI